MTCDRYPDKPVLRIKETMTDRHGHYRDDLQKTGACFYCPRMDWRYPSAILVGEDMTVFCPGCGEAQRAGDENGRPILRPEAAP